MRDTRKPEISVIMPVKNVHAFVAEAIDSILKQTFENFELLIIDDGSEDGTPEYVEKYRDNRVKLFRRPSLGTVYQLNYGLAAASGRFVARHDGDDFSHPDRFLRQIEFMKDHEDVAVVSTAMDLIDENGNYFKTLRYSREPSLDDMMNKCCISHPAAMWRSEIHEIIGGYDEAFNKNCCEDYDLWLRILEHYKIIVMDEVLYVKREHPASSIAVNRWQYVPVYDKMAREKARLRKIDRERRNV